MAYETQPGTIPHRVVEYLKTLKADVEVSAPELAETLGVDAASIVPSLVFACKHGALTRRKREARHSARKVWWYALGDGTPEDPVSDVDEPLTRPPGRPAARPTPEPAPAPALITAEEYVKRIGIDTPAKQRPFDAWLSANGALLVQGLVLDEDGDAILQPRDVLKLRQLLQGVAA